MHFSLWLVTFSGWKVTSHCQTRKAWNARDIPSNNGTATYSFKTSFCTSFILIYINVARSLIKKQFHSLIRYAESPVSTSALGHGQDWSKHWASKICAFYYWLNMLSRQNILCAVAESQNCSIFSGFPCSAWCYCSTLVVLPSKLKAY